MFTSIISAAHAEVAPVPPPAGGSPMSTFIMLGGMLIIFYFFLWRPQSKRAKEHKQLMESLSAGDEVILGGGLMGKIVKTDENYAVIELCDKVEVKVQKMSIVATLPKGTLKSI
jgi:preprotein translocase subunit YajC